MESMPCFKWYCSSFFFFLILTLSAQENKIKLDADVFIGIDNLENTFYIKNNSLFKTGENGNYNYTNLNFGDISKVDISNPLKVLVYYQDFNTIVWLDTNLNEINSPINFNAFFNTPLHYVANAFNNNIWTFNHDLNTVNLVNTNTLAVEKTVLLDQNLHINYITSNYKAMYLFVNDAVIEVNFMGFIRKIDLNEKIDFALCTKKNINYLKDKKLFIFNLKTNTKKLWKELPKKAKTYFVLGKSIYIFEKKYLYTYSLPKSQ